jgi:tetratricopeptide (TPR) repeat protein
MTRALLVLVLVSSVARANVWETAAGSDPNQDNYEKLMKEGDELAEQANSRSIQPGVVKRLVKQAAASYRAAAAAEPAAGEPMYRLGRMLFSFYFECNELTMYPHGPGSPLCNPDPSQFDRPRAEEIVAAWDEFEKRSPLDPRLTTTLGESVVLFERAILNTKLATKEHLEAATHDYEKMLSRTDTGGESGRENTLSNLAETYMMLGRLEEAIDTYREAIARGGSIETAYGLAVALDRSGSGGEAIDEIIKQGADSVGKFRNRVNITHETFFVPEGEQYYYFALLDEAYGFDADAIEYWQKYIGSGAHPEFQPRAKEHLAALAKHKTPERRDIELHNPYEP